MTAQWWALFRPGRPDPEGVNYDKSDLISLALRRAGIVTGSATREPAWKRLRRRGWRIEPLPERFWEESRVAWERQAKANAEAYRRLERSKGSLDLLRELAEDRHGQQWSVNSHSHVIPSGHAGTLRTCPDRLCEAAAALLGR